MIEGSRLEEINHHNLRMTGICEVGTVSAL